MPPLLKRYRPGQTPTAKEINAVIDELDMLRNLDVRDGLVWKRVAGRQTLRLSPEPEKRAVPERLVGVVEGPVPGSGRVRVRRVVFDGLPAVAGRYRFEGGAFDCVPDVGFAEIDFAADVIVEAPAASHLFHRARYATGQWFVRRDGGGSEKRRAVVMDLPQGDWIEVAVADPETGQATTEVLKVALPEGVRRSPFDGQSRFGFSYAYESDVRRVSTRAGTNPAETEIQEITPGYFPGDVITIERVAATGVADPDAPEEEPRELRWRDDNSEWARTYASVSDEA